MRYTDTWYTTTVIDEFRKKDITIIVDYKLWSEDKWSVNIKLKNPISNNWNWDITLYYEHSIKSLEGAKEMARLFVENNFTTWL